MANQSHSDLSTRRGSAPRLKADSINEGAGRAVVIGAGLGGLASAMRLGAKGWQVTVLDRLDRLHLPDRLDGAMIKKASTLLDSVVD